ncbi:adenylate kinase family protein [Kitasatospora sp. NPDC058243]|uniref:adenylate kinase family protein n=1 Tax=Kitasatospora sp. NPDC058243 TaxID=3346397 RepID=UPI0036DA8171
MRNGTPPNAVLVTGPPGAGKSTALMALDDRHPDLARFGVRDYGLRLAAAGHPLGTRMRETLLRQELLPDELVRLEFAHFLDHLPAAVRVVAVEGYPRDLPQCDDLLRTAADRDVRVTGFAVVTVPDGTARTRVANRRLCVECGATTDAPDAPACPGCGGGVMRRRDDAAASFERRLADYHRIIGDLRAYFAERSLLREVDGTRPSDEVRAALWESLDAMDAMDAVDAVDADVPDSTDDLTDGLED